MKYWAYLNNEVSQQAYSEEELKQLQGFGPDVLICSETSAVSSEPDWRPVKELLPHLIRPKAPNFAKFRPKPPMEKPFQETVQNVQGTLPIPDTLPAGINAMPVSQQVQGSQVQNDVSRELLAQLENLTTKITSLETKIEEKEKELQEIKNHKRNEEENETTLISNPKDEKEDDVLEVPFDSDFNTPFDRNRTSEEIVTEVEGILSVPSNEEIEEYNTDDQKTELMTFGSDIQGMLENTIKQSDDKEKETTDKEIIAQDLVSKTLLNLSEEEIREEKIQDENLDEQEKIENQESNLSDLDELLKEENKEADTKENQEIIPVEEEQQTSEEQDIEPKHEENIEEEKVPALNEDTQEPSKAQDINKEEEIPDVQNFEEENKETDEEVKPSVENQEEIPQPEESAPQIVEEKEEEKQSEQENLIPFKDEHITEQEKTEEKPTTSSMPTLDTLGRPDKMEMEPQREESRNGNEENSQTGVLKEDEESLQEVEEMGTEENPTADSEQEEKPAEEILIDHISVPTIPEQKEQPIENLGQQEESETKGEKIGLQNEQQNAETQEKISEIPEQTESVNNQSENGEKQDLALTMGVTISNDAMTAAVLDEIAQEKNHVEPQTSPEQLFEELESKSKEEDNISVDQIIEETKNTDSEQINVGTETNSDLTKDDDFLKTFTADMEEVFLDQPTAIISDYVPPSDNTEREKPAPAETIDSIRRTKPSDIKTVPLVPEVMGQEIYSSPYVESATAQVRQTSILSNFIKWFILVLVLALFGVLVLSGLAWVGLVSERFSPLHTIIYSLQKSPQDINPTSDNEEMAPEAMMQDMQQVTQENDVLPEPQEQQDINTAIINAVKNYPFDDSTTLQSRIEAAHQNIEGEIEWLVFPTEEQNIYSISIKLPPNAEGQSFSYRFNYNLDGGTLTPTTSEAKNIMENFKQ